MIEFNPIGTIHTPFMDRQGMPIQPGGTVELLPEYAAGVQDIRGCLEAVSKPCATNRLTFIFMCVYFICRFAAGP